MRLFRRPSEPNRFGFLLTGLVLFMTVLPVLSGLGRITHALLTEFSLTLLLLAAVWSLTGNRHLFRLGLLLVAATVAATLAYLVRPLPVLVQGVELLSLLFLLLSSGIAFRAVFAEGEVDLNRLAGAASLYLLMALVWALLYSLLHSFDPAALSGLPAPAQAELWDYLYFSFVTLTTLGYGDVLPVSAEARTLAMAEAVVAQFYLTILVAVLVGMLVANRSNR
ncbi:MAG TPA: potassium channel protein [Sedimenticola thiotaurini]|uniref:Potassium channel protein n=1 Tax=Sedimenticola thiotaurini TaxID=1543721 RepID=A0A831RNH0_9GAMM|nr:potassium channel protein [Sedimenticola thiotaurini]